MEETLTDCLVRVREDLSQLEKVRNYLQENAEMNERCSFSWRTIEAFHSILSVCSSQGTSETKALDILLDSFLYLAKNNTDNSVWDNFGFELGIICVKILSAIERTDIFEVLFSKLLSLITVVCEHNSVIWKAASRQILNVLINKKFSLHYFECILKSYICMIRNVDTFVLYDFSSQNLGLLKALSLLVQKVGDFEIQSDIVETIFVHLSRDTKLMSDFFTTTENKLFQTLHFSDFEGDCRLFLNALNTSRREPERKVCSICCQVLYFGGCFMEPPVGRTDIWVDANKDTERVSIKCGDVASSENRVIYVQFSELISVHCDKDKAEGRRCLTIRTKNLMQMHETLKSDDICLVVERADGVFDFINFLESAISEKKRKKPGLKASTTVDCLFIEIRSSEEVQDNAITSSNRAGADIIPKGFASSWKVNPSLANMEMQPKSSQLRTPTKKALDSQKTVFASQELSPDSFAESFNKHLGFDSPEPKHAFEDSVPTVEFLHQSTPGKSHKLFRSPHEIFNIFEANKSETFKFDFEENKENNPLAAKDKQKTKTPIHRRMSQNIPTGSSTVVSPGSRAGKDFRSQNNTEAKLSNIESQDCFRVSPKVLKKKKPCLPKLKRTKKVGNNESPKGSKLSLNENTKSHCASQNNGATERNVGPNKAPPKPWKLEIRGTLKNFKKRTTVTENLNRQQKEKQKSSDNAKQSETEVETSLARETKILLRNEKESKEPKPVRQKQDGEAQNGPGLPVRREPKNSDVGTGKTQENSDAKPSLLDPNGYAYKRWCKPTTSERSNFWLKKLEAQNQKQKSTDLSVFDFFEDIDPVSGNNVRKEKKSKTVLSRRPRRAREAKEASLRPSRTSKVSPKTPSGKGKPTDALPPDSPPLIPHAEEHAPSEDLLTSFNSDCLFRGSSPDGLLAKDAEDEQSDSESASGDDGPPQPLRSKKREHSDEDSSTRRICLKKKPKTILSSRIFLSIMRRRLQKAEERDKHLTDQVVQTVNEAVDRLVDHLQKKVWERARSCLKSSEAASRVVDGEIPELNLRAKRIRRAILYFQAGCSVSDFCKNLDEHFSRVRDSLKAFSRKGDTSKAIDRIGDRLSSLIATEMERAIKNEWKSQQDLLLKCSCLETDFTEFPASEFLQVPTSPM